MDTLVRVVTHVHYNTYSNHPERIEPIFNLFLTTADGEYAMAAVHAATGVPTTTLYSWREQVRADPEWRPSAEHFALAHRALPDDVEELIAQFIRCQFLALGRGVNRPILRSVVFMILHSLVAEKRVPETTLNFKCSNHFLKRLLLRHGLSFRRARAARRPEINDEECLAFLCALNKAREEFSPDHIVNFDESNWHLVMVGDEVVGELGSEVVHNYANGDAKANFTFFASIRADGSRLPLILIARGKTQRCHQQFGDHPGYQHEIWHSPRGWSTESLMEQYLQWLSQQFNGDPLCLILDQFGTHCGGGFTNLAGELGMRIIWIPKGATGIYQPLDRRVFGALKAKGRAKWRRFFFEHYGIRCTRELAAGLLLESWAELSDDVFLSGWNFDETPDELEPDDDSSDDDEFELRVHSESDGDDTWIEECEIESDESPC